MKLPVFTAIAVFSASFAMAQASPATLLSPGTTLPIQFERSIDTNHSHTGDTVSAKTTQQVRLANGEILPAGAHVTGHVVTSNAFTFDKTPYAKQPVSTLAIHFDSIESKGKTLPLQVYVRAMADPVTVWDAQRPKATDMDPLSTTTQIGGDQVVPSQSEVTSRDGDTVGYRKRGGVYAHLISTSGNGPENCDASDTEQSMGLFSASACGLYGFTDVTLLSAGKTGEVSTLALASRRRSAKIWAKSAALLEVVGDGSNAVTQ
ncbi:hypothetical protein [Granulicella sp. dw_53]|uniref:hypothetical protein n=1 Tax=Granulicella sp. dw_53 TaxID=2719792 RepID=UPI001BD52DB9|nr:hypothetical protein [Granulicella sp. dw_53]